MACKRRSTGHGKIRETTRHNHKSECVGSQALGDGEVTGKVKEGRGQSRQGL